MVQRLSLLRHRQRCLTHFAKYFMELTFHSTAALDRIPVLRVGGGEAVEKVWKMCKLPEKKGRRDRENRGNPRNFPVKNRQRFRMAL